MHHLPYIDPLPYTEIDWVPLIIILLWAAFWLAAKSHVKRTSRRDRIRLAAQTYTRSLAAKERQR